MVFRTIINLVDPKRVPLIKFRKGGYDSSSAGTIQNTNAIEDWELPPRFARKPISAEEIEYINNGGPTQMLAYK